MFVLVMVGVSEQRLLNWINSAGWNGMETMNPIFHYEAGQCERLVAVHGQLPLPLENNLMRVS